MLSASSSVRILRRIASTIKPGVVRMLPGRRQRAVRRSEDPEKLPKDPGDPRSPDSAVCLYLSGPAAVASPRLFEICRQKRLVLFFGQAGVFDQLFEIGPRETDHRSELAQL